MEKEEKKVPRFFKLRPDLNAKLRQKSKESRPKTTETAIVEEALERYLASGCINSDQASIASTSPKAGVVSGLAAMMTGPGAPQQKEGNTRKKKSAKRVVRKL